MKVNLEDLYGQLISMGMVAIDCDREETLEYINQLQEQFGITVETKPCFIFAEGETFHGFGFTIRA